MADTYTEPLGLIKMETNSHENDWGEQLNDNFEVIDTALGVSSHATTGGTTTLSQEDALPMMHTVTGALLSAAIFTIPATSQRPLLWKNETTGSFSLTVKTPSGTGVTVTQGDARWLRADGTNVVDAGIPTFSQISGLSSWVGTITDTNTYVAADNGYIDALADGLRITGYIQNTNTSATVTLNYNSLGGKEVVHNDGSAVAIGDVPAGSVMSFVYRLASDKWFMTAPPLSILPRLASNNTWAGKQTFSKGLIEAPTSLTDAATIAWDMSATGRNVTVTLGGNRTLDAPTNVNTGQWGFLEVVQDGTGSRTLSFHANFDPMGTPVVDRTASSRTVFGYYARSSSAIELWPLYKSGLNSIGFYKEYDKGTLALGAATTQAHGLGITPALVQAYLECTSTDVGYAVGDRIVIDGSGVKDSANDRGISIHVNTTNVVARVGAAEAYLLSSAGANTQLTSTKWKLILRVYE